MNPRYLSLLLLLLLAACARQTTPTGGPKDKKPPILISSSPAINETNFKKKILTFTFDEAVQVKDAREEIIIAPSPGKDITYIAKQNRIIITLKTPLQDTTTYNINFREGILDLTESNPPVNLRVAFSTGPILDTLMITGKVTDALTEKIPDHITVAVYQSDTFNISKHTPSYLTKTDDFGNYQITNLKAGTYRLYAFDDKNKNLKLESNAERYGFIPGKIELTANAEKANVSLVTLDARPLFYSNIRHNNQYSKIKFNKQLVEYHLTTPPPQPISTFGDDQSEINIYFPENLQDSLGISIHAIDSLDQSLDTLLYIKKGTLKLDPDKFAIQVTDVTLNPETILLNAKVTFNKPIIQTLRDSIYIAIDSAHRIAFDSVEIRYDTIRKTTFISKTLQRILIDSAKTPISLYLGKDAFRSIDGDSSARNSKPLTLPKQEDVATLELQIQTSEPHFIIQLLTPDYKIVQTAYDLHKVTFKNVPAGTYKIRSIADTNQNHKWDPGNIKKDIPPERTFYYQNNDSKYEFPLRANWEVGPYTVSF